MCHGSIAAAWGSVARPAALTKALLRRTAGFVLGRWLRAGGFARLPVVGRPASARHEIGTPDFRSGYAGSYAQGTLPYKYSTSCYATAMLVPPYWYQALVPSPTSASEDPGLSVIAVKPVDAVAALTIAIVPPGLSV